MHSKLAFWIVGTNFQSSYVEPDEVVSQIGKPSCLSGTTNNFHRLLNTQATQPPSLTAVIVQRSALNCQQRNCFLILCSEVDYGPILWIMERWVFEHVANIFEHFPRLRVFGTCDPESSPMPGTSSMWGQSSRYIRKNTFLLTIQQLSHIVLDFQEMDFCDSGSGDGCARSFPNKLSPGLCAKCTKLATFTEGSAEYEQWKVCHPSRPLHMNVDFYFFH